ncbi:Acg family FMN-binding oxidoreductase [Nocardia cyriacigeorgica]|uniref:Acg family FMN-binding oxidoreductase n=1 Tax=Nocardia cyriacigeorgica TaxID=135487 RepID=UPI001893A769|nr:hypothetical protein [Nocardia cyriacigeorgica]MBF6434868.1 hypothetical protein [Nocardia cyriacigeorgica]
MPCSSLDLHTADIALNLAVRAPSIHNTQPWRWRIGRRGIDLFADTSRGLGATDPHERALVVSCGVVLHHLRVAFAALGWATSVERRPDPRDPDHLAHIDVTRRPPSDSDIELAAAILMRQTDRRHYLHRPVPARLIRALAQRAADCGAVVRQIPEPWLPRLAGPMRRAAASHATDSAYQAELARWSSGERSTDGVPGRNAPPPRAAGEIPVRTFADATLADSADQPDAAVWLVVGTARDDRQSQLRAGEATSAVLLTATDRGLATSLQTEPLGMADPRQEIRAGLLHDCAYPQAMVRVGWMAHTAAPLTSTPRRPVADVLEI